MEVNGALQALNKLVPSTVWKRPVSAGEETLLTGAEMCPEVQGLSLHKPESKQIGLSRFSHLVLSDDGELGDDSSHLFLLFPLFSHLPALHRGRSEPRGSCLLAISSPLPFPAGSHPFPAPPKLCRPPEWSERSPLASPRKKWSREPRCPLR